jgi:peptidoglycan/xylan/chitin deacetylase (PgdA/CDA1 family)
MVAGLAVLLLLVAAPGAVGAEAADEGLAVGGWEGASTVDRAERRPVREVTLAGEHAGGWRLQLKTGQGWRTRRIGSIAPGAGTLRIALPATWRSLAVSAWRLAVALPGGGVARTGVWVVARAPVRPPVDCANAKCVALTFDDGPSDYTRRYLRVLARHDAVATFFVIGAQISGRAHVLRRAAYEGHEIAAHTWTHRDLTTLSAAEIGREVRRTAGRIERATGVRPSLVRPPYGTIDSRVARVLATQGLAAVLWSVDTRDWEHRSPARVLAHVERDTRRGGIVLMHDLHAASVRALDEIIDLLHGRGYTLVTVSELLAGVDGGSGPEPGGVYRSG